MGPLPDVEIKLVDGSVLTDELDGGAGVEDIEPAMAAPDFGESRLDARLVGDVGDEREGPVAELPRGGLDGRRVAVHEPDDGPFADEGSRGPVSDATAGTGADRDLAV